MDLKNIWEKAEHDFPKNLRNFFLYVKFNCLVFVFFYIADSRSTINRFISMYERYVRISV